MGYAYVCNGATVVQEVKEYDGSRVEVTDDVERPNSVDDTFEVFQADRPESCAVMASPSTGAMPGTLLVAVTWAAPQLTLSAGTAVELSTRQRVLACSKR